MWMRDWEGASEGREVWYNTVGDENEANVDKVENVKKAA